MKERKWLILTALAMEANAIARKFGLKRVSFDGENLLPGIDADLRVIRIRATRLTAEMCEGVTGGIILAGLAGALDPSLTIGQIVIDEPASTGSRPSPWAALPYLRGKIYTADRVICDVAGKGELFHQTGAIAVDMESEIVATFAATAGLPMLTIRAISDTANDALPPEMLGWIDEFGRPQPMKVASGLATHPQRIRELMRLGKRSKIAAQNMAETVHTILRKD